MGSNIPCDFKNVIPGSKSSERVAQVDKSNYNQALDDCKKISNFKGNDDAAVVGKSIGFDSKDGNDVLIGSNKEIPSEKIVSGLVDTDDVIVNDDKNSFNKTNEDFDDKSKDKDKEKEKTFEHKDQKRESNFSKNTFEKKEMSDNYVNSLLG
jgi:hypothetical protein